MKEKDCIVFGETIDTEEKIKREANAFRRFLEKNQKKITFELMCLFARKKNWVLNSLGEPYVSDIMALLSCFEVEYGFGRHVSSKIRKYLFNSDGEQTRETIIEEIIRKNEEETIKQGGKIVDARELEAVHKKREDAVKVLHNSTNNSELEAAKFDYIKAQKEFLTTLGCKPCGARDCTQYIKNRKSTAKYCSDACRRKERSRRWRAKNPEKKIMANQKYTATAYPEIDEAVQSKIKEEEKKKHRKKQEK